MEVMDVEAPQYASRAGDGWEVESPLEPEVDRGDAVSLGELGVVTSRLAEAERDLPHSVRCWCAANW